MSRKKKSCKELVERKLVTREEDCLQCCRQVHLSLVAVLLSCVPAHLRRAHIQRGAAVVQLCCGRAAESHSHCAAATPARPSYGSGCGNGAPKSRSSRGFWEFT
ncbi:hypothetical protein AMECASPLE_008799 [Ameca splendens]|uniref:Uncharacterized protein n=1 Tax=Ameca splendens TaxID=208324 RepID=A0ABV0YXX9_9TELE